MTDGELAALGASLRELALDLRWTWSHEADALWEEIDPEGWEHSHNPWTLLKGTPPVRLAALAADPAFLQRLQQLAALRQDYVAGPTWFERCRRGSIASVGYFSLEFGLGAGLPLYAGGLGVLAGDYLKAASDLGAPVIGVGLLYQEGYFRQVLDEHGGQRELFPFNDPADMPIAPVRMGEDWLRVRVELPGRDLVLRVWKATVGRAALYLLDSNDPLNTHPDRAATAQLYGDGPELRIIQELALGVGGWRALCAMGIEPEICHANEGHSALALVERARAAAVRFGLSFEEAVWAARPGGVFTTHTPVPAGFDVYDPALVERSLAPVFGADAQGLATTLALGRAPGDAGGAINTAFLAMRAAGAAFAVSRAHAEVSRSIFQPLFPRWPRAETPIRHVTNGVHTPSWDSAAADDLWTAACGQERWRGEPQEAPGLIASASDEQIWSMRGRARHELVGRMRRRLERQLASSGRAGDPAEVRQALDPNVLTLGFARRFTEYKRPNLLLTDPQRLRRILGDPARPVQIVLAGKAHPADRWGKEMIREWVAFAADPQLRRRVVFLEDYDLALAQELVAGVDVWINTPRAPWEACGTSGMKVLVNGGLNCSVLDGWWAEAYEPGAGWALEPDPGCGPDRDRCDAEALYALIEGEIAPDFYACDESGLPRAWIARIRQSMSRLTARFGATRMLIDYLDESYVQGAARLKARLADCAAGARAAAGRAQQLSRHWSGLHLGEPSFSQAGEAWRVTAPVLFGEIPPDDVAVQLYAEGEAGPRVVELARGEPIPGAANGHLFAGEAPADRPAGDYTVRVVPRIEGVDVPAELPLIAWQR